MTLPFAGAAAQLDSVLKAAASEPEAAKGQTKAPEPSEEDLAARWEAELSDVGEDDLERHIVPPQRRSITP